MKKNIIKKFILSFTACFILIFNSCLGSSVDIQMNRDGSGRVTMEYHISNTLINFGMLDGNESMPPVPVNRRDFQRAIDRIEGLRLVSYSSRQTSKDTIVNTVLEFSNTQTLITLLDSSFTNVTVTQNGNHGSLNIIINSNASSHFNPDLVTLAAAQLEGYNFSLSFSAPSSSSMTITNAQGNALQLSPNAHTQTSGRKVSLSLGMFDALTFKDGLGLNITW